MSLKYWLSALLLFNILSPAWGEDKGWNPGETIQKIARGADEKNFWMDNLKCCSSQGGGFFTLETQWGEDRNYGRINDSSSVSPWGFNWGIDSLDNRLYAALTTDTSQVYTPNNVYIGFHENLPQLIPNTFFGGMNHPVMNKAALTAQLVGAFSWGGFGAQGRWMGGLSWYVSNPPVGEPHSFVVELNIDAQGGPQPHWSPTIRAVDNSYGDVKALYLGSRYWCNKDGFCSTPSTGFKGISNRRQNVWIDWKNILKSLRCSKSPSPCLPDWAYGPYQVTAQYFGQETFGMVFTTLYVKYFRQMAQ
jgi:hypothetical protein